MSASEDRSRNKKDQVATYLTTNLLPQHQQNNNGSWKSLERYLQDLAEDANLDFSIIAGGYGTKIDKNSIDVIDDKGKPQTINVPSSVWKVVAWRNYGESTDEVRGAFAVFMPNENIAGIKWDKYLRSVQDLEGLLNSDATSHPQYSFLTGIQDDNERNNLKQIVRLPVSAPLLATNLDLYVDTATSPVFVPDTSIRHNSLVEANALEFYSFQVSSGQISFPQTTTNNIVAQISPSQISTIKSYRVQPSFTQIGSPQVSTLEANKSQISSNQIGIAEIGIPKTTLPEARPTKISTTEVSSIQVGFGHRDIAQITATQINISQVGTNFRATQINSTQVATAQNIITPIGKPDISKISFPSRIALQQFFNSNLSSSHTSVSEFLYNINFTAPTLFDPTTPFNLTFQITDLPTGQLAEAQITNYDSLGRPNGGTILIDCTSLALVDDARGESALLRGENQNCGVEQKDCHEGDSSTAPVAQNEKSVNSAIANQTQGQVEQGYSASLPEENQVSGVEVKAAHEGEASAAPVTEKWSHEAIVARSNMRPVRREKLNRAANSGHNPGFDFLQQCCHDDPALQIVIKKLLAKFPQWGIACVDGVLVDWER